jgi:hypothetical protein
MNARVTGTWGTGIVSTCCALWLAACSSQEHPTSGADAAADADLDLVVTIDSCSITSHTLVPQAPPNDCTFTFDQVPRDPTSVKFKTGGKTIPQSDTEGWVYEPGMLAITLSGSYCQSVRDGTITELTMLVGCGPEVIR